MSFYEKGPVCIQYEEAGSGFPLLLVPGGGLNSTIAGLKRGRPFDAIEEFKEEYRCIFSDMYRRLCLPNAISRAGQMAFVRQTIQRNC